MVLEGNIDVVGSVNLLKKGVFGVACRGDGFRAGGIFFFLGGGVRRPQ